MPLEGRNGSRRSLEERMDNPPHRPSRNYQYSKSNQGYSRPRSVDSRVKQHNHHRQQEQLSYDDSTPTGFDAENMYDDQEKDEGTSVANKTLEDRITTSGQDYNGDISQEVNGEGSINQNEANTINGSQRLSGSSKVRAAIVVSKICTKYFTGRRTIRSNQ